MHKTSEETIPSRWIRGSQTHTQNALLRHRHAKRLEIRGEIQRRNQRRNRGQHQWRKRVVLRLLQRGSHRSILLHSADLTITTHSLRSGQVHQPNSHRSLLPDSTNHREDISNSAHNPPILRSLQSSYKHLTITNVCTDMKPWSNNQLILCSCRSSSASREGNCASTSSASWHDHPSSVTFLFSGCWRRRERQFRTAMNPVYAMSYSAVEYDSKSFFLRIFSRFFMAQKHSVNTPIQFFAYFYLRFMHTF